MASASTDRVPPAAEASPANLAVKEELHSASAATKSAEPAPLRNATRAELLYEKCCEAPAGMLFFQRDLVHMEVAETVGQLAELTGELINRHLMKLMTLDNEPCWKIRTRQEADMLRSMSVDEREIYHMIDAEQNKGVWSQAVRARTGKTIAQINKILKGLETKGLVQSVLSVKHPNRRMYLLKHLRPAEEIAGGPWQSEGDFDAALIEAISNAVAKYVQLQTCIEVPGDYNAYTPADRSAAIAQKKSQLRAVRDIEEAPAVQPYVPPRPSNRAQLVYKAKQSYPTADSIRAWIEAKNIIRDDKIVTTEDMEQLLDMMVLEGRLEKVSGTSYRTPMSAMDKDSYNGFVDAPCGNCPVFDICADDGEISARTCIYFGEWLETESEHFPS